LEEVSDSLIWVDCTTTPTVGALSDLLNVRHSLVIRPERRMWSLLQMPRAVRADTPSTRSQTLITKLFDLFDIFQYFLYHMAINLMKTALRTL